MSVRRFLLSPTLIMLVPPLLWGGNAVAGRMAAGSVPPLALAFWRWFFAFLLLLPWGWPRVRAQWPLVRRQWKLLAWLALSSVTAYNSLLYVALTTTTAVNATLVSAAIPVAIVALSWLWLKERISPLQGGGILLSLAGVLLVIAHGDLTNLLALRLHAGDLWALAAVVSWALFSVTLRRFPSGLAPLALLTVQVGLGTLFILPLYLGELALGHGFTLTAKAAGLIAYVAVLPSLVAYGLWNKGVADLGANIAGLYTNLIPVFTALLAVPLLGESFHWFHGAGMALIFAGIALATRRK
ncbi:putative DMT superfamily transporter inner membrane protein [mine drainage metagenome]|uniref:Putative DMT superfamily transporter inner membrane protein n=1 Tax=mine drainage metagenome TaxID=410659 RepID=A0A1J5RNV5_9ZZZZ